VLTLMRSALVIGGRGQCGTAIGERLVADGWDVTATTAGPIPDSGTSPAIRWIALKRDEIDHFGGILSHDTDLVVDVTAFTAHHAEQLLSLGGRIGAIIAVSTLSVYTDSQQRSLDEATNEASFPAWPVPIPEDWPTLAPGDDNYSTRKAALEAVLRERAACPVTIVRPGAIYGRRSHHLREWYFIKRVLDGRRQVVLPFNGASIFQPTAATNLATLISLAASTPGDRTLNCGDLDPPTVSSISSMIDDLMNWSTERVLVSGAEPEPTVGNHPWSVPRPVVADMSRAQNDLGYCQAVTYQEALSQTLSWVLSACAGRDWREVFPRLAGYPTDLFDYDAEDSFLAGLATSTGSLTDPTRRSHRPLPDADRT
jgi:nucleoside-diphosphate-sugar epimerase